MTTEAHPDYIKYCRGKDFLLSKDVDGKDGFECLKAISEAKQKLELTDGAKMGAGDSRDHLEATGFVEMKPFGAGKIVANEELCLHHGNLGERAWVKPYQGYAAVTKHGVLILAKTLDKFRFWAKSKACIIEVNEIPDGRLYAYLEHNEDDAGGRCGYIVSLDTQNETGSATVRNGKGYMVWSNGAGYHGGLKDGKQHGEGRYKYANAWNGTYIHPDVWENDVYVGGWKYGKKHGKGVYTFANGAVYDGEWKDDKKHGKGLYTYDGGDVWHDGEWKDGKPA